MNNIQTLKKNYVDNNLEDFKLHLENIDHNIFTKMLDLLPKYVNDFLIQKNQFFFPFWDWLEKNSEKHLGAFHQTKNKIFYRHVEHQIKERNVLFLDVNIAFNRKSNDFEIMNYLTHWKEGYEYYTNKVFFQLDAKKQSYYLEASLFSGSNDNYEFLNILDPSYVDDFFISKNTEKKYWLNRYIHEIDKHDQKIVSLLKLAEHKNIKISDIQFDNLSENFFSSSLPQTFNHLRTIMNEENFQKKILSIISYKTERLRSTETTQGYFTAEYVAQLKEDIEFLISKFGHHNDTNFSLKSKL